MQTMLNVLKKGQLYTLVMLLVIAGCAGSKNAGVVPELPASSLKPFGRYVIDEKQQLELISSAVHFGFTFDGKECRVYASAAGPGAHNYLQYELDGDYVKKVRIDGNESSPLVITAAKKGKHTVWIYKTTEAHSGPVMIQKVSGTNIQAIEVPDAPVVEFIGNSITCGAAADPSTVPCNVGEYHDHHDAYHAYGPRVARNLHVNFLMSCVSGIGIYRNWNSDGPTMPQVYEKTDLQAGSIRPWDFKNYTPAIVSIALGTNDFSNGDGIKKRAAFDSAAFVLSYINFVKLVKSKYPDARIALLSSPMVSGNNGARLESYLTIVKQAIDVAYPASTKISLFFFKPMQPHGCAGHPGVEDHGILAAELTPFFEALLH